ncbi:ABC transporter ATP-binding protein [Pseudonocardia zijingensis]|uniref:ABC transporter ATP-binding protein n=1 Tax=Pseudonocardia zijingensis TaxID=153376 RepID=A0ABN1PW96_9PSEU
MISAHDISFSYGETLVLSDAALVARSGETVGLIGPNGSGKTTLLRVLHGAIRPETATISLDGTPLREFSGRQLARRIAVVAQENPSEIPMTVADMVLLGRSPLQTSFQRYTAADHRAAAAALRRVGARGLADREFRSLSGGERQRVLIARALAQEADHLLLDEPTNHLDVRYQHEVLGLVRALDLTTVVVLHDLNLAARYCDRLVLLHRGKVVAAGDPGEVLTPEVLEPVYDVAVRRFVELGAVQLVFGPHPDPRSAGVVAR